MTAHRVVFTPLGLRTTAEPGETVFDVALRAGVDIQSICGGRGLCGRCQVEVSTGSHAKFGLAVADDHLSPGTDSEARFARHGVLRPGRRLACRATVCGDVVIDIPPDARSHGAIQAKAGTAIDVPLDPPVRLALVKLPVPDLTEAPADADAVIAALAELGLTVSVDPLALPALQPILAKHDREVIAVVRDGARVVDFRVPDAGHLFGAALDIGSTSLALYIYDLSNGDLVHQASAMNPQIRYGEDLMSRVSYVMLNKGGAEQLTGAVRQGVATMLADGCAAAGIAIAHLVELVFVGNPVMHHLFLGISPVELGQAPFTLAVRDWVDLPASALGLGLSPAARVSALPLVGGHVGADTTGAYLTQIERMTGRTTVLVDIGTNAEIVMSHQGRVAACSSPTGPAFEGAEISAGVRAAPGAIERVRIDPASGRARVKLIGDDDWIDDSADNLARITGICGSGIFEALVEMANAGLIDRSGKLRAEAAPDRFIDDGDEGKVQRYVLIDRPGAPICVTQRDVRAVQLAKAALAAGVQLLADHLGVTTLDEVLLAGAFGTHLDPEYVAGIGIVPGSRAEIIRIVGNAAGMGAAMCLTNRASRDRIIAATREIEKVETATEPMFQSHFVAAMPFPTAPEAAPTRNRRSRHT